VGMRSESHTHLTTGGSAAKDFSNAASGAPSHLIEPSTLHLHANERRLCLERWSQLIGAYSRNGISFIEDRLPACSALAQQMQPILGTYIAGLWKSHLPGQLLWHYDAYNHHDPYSGRMPQTNENLVRRSKCPSCRLSKPSNLLVFLESM
jgi:rubredoxin